MLRVAPRCSALLRVAPRCSAAYAKIQTDALLNLEHVFIVAAIGSFLFLFAVTVQIELPHFAKSVHQTLAHSAKRRVIQITVIGDETQNAAPAFGNAILRVARELDVIVVEPFRIAFAQIGAIDFEI